MYQCRRFRILKCMQLRKPCRNFGLWLSGKETLLYAGLSKNEIRNTDIARVEGVKAGAVHVEHVRVAICHALMRNVIVHCCAKVSAYSIRSLRCGGTTASHMRAMALSADSSTFQVIAPLEQGTKKLAVILAGDARVGDCICLHGDVGAGKSVFRSAPTSWAQTVLHCLNSTCKGTVIKDTPADSLCSSAAVPSSEHWLRMITCLCHLLHISFRTPMMSLKVCSPALLLLI